MTGKPQVRVLVVEDLPDISDSYRFHLERAGYCVDIVETRKAATEALKAKYYDVALVDLSLKNDVTHKGGIDVLDTINHLDDGTKAIVISATSEIKDSIASYDRGINGFIMKDAITSKEIIKRIESAISGHQRPVFGDFPTLTAYLAAPNVTPIWEHQVHSALGCGFDSMSKILWKTFKPYLPVIRKRDGAPSLAIDKARSAVGGMFWSKGEGSSIWFSARGERGSFLEPKTPASQLIAEFSEKNVLAAVWRTDVPRDQFLETIRDKPGVAK